MRLWSYQAVAHGADTIMFFQMRRSIGACEKYHGAVIDHVGNENTRVFREVAALGKELEEIGDLTLGGRTKARIGLLFDWDNWWSIEYSAGPSCELRYLTEFERYYETLRKMNYDVDIIGMDDALEPYVIVIAPVLYMVKGDYDEKIRSYTRNGGIFVTTFFSGIVQENDLVTLGGYPGKLRDIMGIWVEEIDALPNGEENEFTYEGEKYPAKLLCDIIYTEGAKPLSEYEKDFYAGSPAVTVNSFGKGKAYYIGTASSEAFYQKLLTEICEDAGVAPVLKTPEMVEVTSRENEKGRYLFVMNHADESKKISLSGNYKDIITGKDYHEQEMVLPGKDVAILREEK